MNFHESKHESDHEDNHSSANSQSLSLSEDDTHSSIETDSSVEVYLRIRPSNIPSGFLRRDEFNENALAFNVPKAEGLIVNNTRTNFNFLFNGILDTDSDQDEVFRIIGAPAVHNALNGFNSTIFAYGQTGSGKTFTITGGPERYADRGIIPRAISLLFEEFSKRANNTTYTCQISYLEIYNENGHDLLASNYKTSTAKVTMLEDEDGKYHFRNLSSHAVSSEEDALNQLFIGDTNRAIGETEMNATSSRSHCIFTITIEARRANDECSVIRSKLNMVDLAGSERVHKTSSNGQTLTEAKHINSSLFFLEMVIVALHEKATCRGQKVVHIPYRNSMMTSVLRDSLGGNCMTKMIATISPEEAQTDESISTCNFAQRVALVKNNATINEELEPEVLIRRLRSEVMRLREEIKFLKKRGDNMDEDDKENASSLTQSQRDELLQQVVQYIEDRDVYAKLNIGRITLAKIYDVYAIFKNLVLEARDISHLQRNNDDKSVNQSNITIEKLQNSLKQRDRDITTLVKLIKEGKTYHQIASIIPTTNNCDDAYYKNEIMSILTKDQSLPSEPYLNQSDQMLVYGVERCNDMTILEDPQTAYNWFKVRHSAFQSLQENTTVLKDKYSEAKQTASFLSRSKESIANLKVSMERLRKERAIDYIRNSSGTNIDNLSYHNDSEQNRHVEELEKEKESYNKLFLKLKELKATIEYLHQLLEKGKIKVQCDFDKWYRVMTGEYMHQHKNSSIVQSSLGNKDSQNFNNSEIRKEGKVQNSSNGSYKVPSEVRLTGNKKVDDDIIAFYKAKEILMKRNK